MGRVDLAGDLIWEQYVSRFLEAGFCQGPGFCVVAVRRRCCGDTRLLQAGDSGSTMRVGGSGPCGM
jgi:hypothetical protein